MIKCVKHIGTRTITHYQGYTIIAAKATSYRGEIAHMTTAKGTSNRKYATIGSHNQCKKDATRRITTCAETCYAKRTLQEKGKVEYFPEEIWPCSKNTSRKNRNGQTANKTSGCYVFHQNADNTSNLSWSEDTCQPAYSQWKRCTGYTQENRQKTPRPIRREASNGEKKTEMEKTSKTRVEGLYHEMA